MDRVGLTDTVRAVVAALRREELGFFAAALAYYAFVSAVPLLLVAVAVASAVGGEAFADTVLVALRDALSAEAAGVLEEALTSGTGREGATAVGLLVFTWSGLRLFRGLDHAFGRIYGATGPGSTLGQLRDATVALVALGAAIVATVGASWLLPFDRLPLVGLVGTLVSAFVLAAVFLPLYYVLPDPPVSITECLPGAVVAGVGWTVLGITFSMYADVAGGFQLYGVLAGVLLLLTWLYFGGLLVLAGAVLNVTLAEESPDRQLQHPAPQSEDNDQP